MEKNIEKIIDKINEQKDEISKMYYSCESQQNGFQFWIYLDLDTLEVKESSMLTMSTCPNPANWYPETNDIIIDYINTNALDHISVEDEKFYKDNPDCYLDDNWDEYLEKYERILRKELNK